MKEFLDNNYVKVIFFFVQDKECWYLFVFGIYYLKKLGWIGCVFDLLVIYEIMFLNSELFFGFNL